MGKAKQNQLLEPRFIYVTKKKAKSNKKKNYKNNKQYLYDDFYYWSREIRMAHNYSCVYCGSSRKLSAHHIFSKSKYPGLKFNLGNGILLCIKCHKNIHKLNDIMQ
jgi:5-methylcytosine-specific restriction endonuclease McrA